MKPGREQLELLVWKRRTAVGSNIRRSLSMRIRAIVRQAELDGWGETAQQILTNLRTSTSRCPYCGAGIKTRTRLLDKSCSPGA